MKLPTFSLRTQWKTFSSRIHLWRCPKFSSSIRPRSVDTVSVDISRMSSRSISKWIAMSSLRALCSWFVCVCVCVRWRHFQLPTSREKRKRKQFGIWRSRCHVQKIRTRRICSHFGLANKKKKTSQKTTRSTSISRQRQKKNISSAIGTHKRLLILSSGRAICDKVKNIKNNANLCKSIVGGALPIRIVCHFSSASSDESIPSARGFNAEKRKTP